MGPFELWDALGVDETVKRMEHEGRHIPHSISRMLATGARSFYRAADQDGTPHNEHFSLLSNEYEPIEKRPGVLALSDIKRARGVVKKNAGASLIDLGSGVLCLEFHSKMNSLGEDAGSMIHAGIKETNRTFAAMGIDNEGPDISEGADLNLDVQGDQQ